jgi:hypothetical protein
MIFVSHAEELCQTKTGITSEILCLTASCSKKYLLWLGVSSLDHFQLPDLRSRYYKKLEVIPIPGNNFIFKQRESGLKSLKKEGASIEKYNPFFFKRFSAQGPRLNMKLFPGIGIK